MTDLKSRLEEILSLAEKASPGPWFVEPSNKWNRIRYHYKSYDHGNDESAFLGMDDPFNRCATFNNQDAPFIASSRTIVPKLAQALQEAIACLEEVTTGRIEIAGGRMIHEYKTHHAEIAEQSLSQITAILCEGGGEK